MDIISTSHSSAILILTISAEIGTLSHFETSTTVNASKSKYRGVSSVEAKPAMSHFKLDPAFLDEHREVRWIQDHAERDSRQKEIFLREVLPTIVYHRSARHEELKALVKTHPWLHPLASLQLVHEDHGCVNFGPGKPYRFNEMVQNLLKNPLADTLIMAEFIRLYRCMFLNVHMSLEAPLYYAFGKADFTILENKEAKELREWVRKGVQDKRESNNGIGWNLNDEFWTAANSNDDRKKFIQQFCGTFKLRERIAWSEMIKSLEISIKAQKEDSLWEIYKDFDRWIHWEWFKDNIRDICLKARSPIAHDGPLENIAELRKHLDRHNEYYSTVAELNNKLETQQRIVTNLSFRHLLESLPGPKEGRIGDNAQWVRFWGRALQLAEFEKDRKEGEKNGEFEAAWHESREKLKKEAVRKKEDEAKKRMTKPTKPEFQRLTETGALKELEESSRMVETEKETPAAQATNEALENKNSLSKVQVDRGVEGEEESKKRVKEKAEQQRLNSPRIQSPLVAMLMKFPKTKVDKVGSDLYGTLSDNIHQYSQDAYEIKESQWDSLPYHLLNAMKPENWKKSTTGKSTGEEDWSAEKKRFVLDMFV